MKERFMSERGSVPGFLLASVALAGFMGGSAMWILSQKDATAGSWKYVVQCPDAYHPHPSVAVVAEPDGGHLLRFSCDTDTPGSAAAPSMQATDIWPLHHPEQSSYGNADPSDGTLWQATIRYDIAKGITTFGGHARAVLDDAPDAPYFKAPVVEVSALGRLGFYHGFSVTGIGFQQLPR